MGQLFKISLLHLFDLRLMATFTLAKAPSGSEHKTPCQKLDAEASTDRNDTIDIEHVPVNDDPRQWSRTRKVRA